MDTREPLEVRWETAEPTTSSRPMDTMSLDIEMQRSAYRTDRRRAMLYYLEHHRAANNSVLLDVDRDAFLEALGEGTEPTRELLQTAVHAFLRVALRHPNAQTSEGWHARGTKNSRNFFPDKGTLIPV